MVTLANLGSVRLPSLKFVGLRARKIRRIQCVSCRSTTVSQLFEPQVQKIAVFTYRSPHFCFPWRRSCDYYAICCMDGKTIQCLSNPSQHVPIYLQQFPSYSNRKCKKSPFSRIAGHIFVFPGDAPATITLCCMNEKTIQCLPNLRSMYLSIFNSFRVI